MTDMIERVARALCLRAEQSEQRWATFTGDARAAIEAMREPTQEMIMAGEAECFEWMAAPESVDQWRLDATKDGYIAMIDAALGKS